MMKFDEVINTMERIASSKLAAEWDNSGVQIDVGKDTVAKVLIALEITNEVIDEAIGHGADLIVTHHPLLFDPLSRIDRGTITGGRIIKLFNAGISVYSAHTNFDVVEGGNNDHIAFLLKLKNAAKLECDSMLTVGLLPEEMKFRDVCGYVKETLGLEMKFFNTTGNPEAGISRIGICTGAGSDLIDEAIEAGCDLFITGDIKYHDARYAAEKGICLLDAWHYGLEKFFPENYSGKLAEATGGKIEIVTSTLNLDPFYIT